MKKLSTLVLVASLGLAAPAFAYSPADLRSNPFLGKDEVVSAPAPKAETKKAAAPAKAAKKEEKKAKAAAAPAKKAHHGKKKAATATEAK